MAVGTLDGKVAIVTGGGGHIGRGIVRAFVKEGAKVVIADRYEDAAEAALEQVRQLEGDGMALTVDVADEEQVKDMVAQTVERFGQVDILVNAAQSWTGASSAHQGSPVESIPEEWWNESFDTGARASWFCCKAVFPHMKDRGGKIVNFASIMGIIGWPGAAAYNANKEAIRALTRTAAVEWGKHGINVNNISPSALTPQNALVAEGEDPEEWIQQRAAQIPMRRVGDPEKDIGRTAVFLCSEDADYVTGQTFMVDGGAHML